MKRIKEVLVVEGKHDTEKLKKYFDCETIETNGLFLNQDTIDRLKKIQDKRGIILLLDPDSAGSRIRQRINDAIPGCKNAFINKEDARSTKKVGIECASQSAIEEALENLVTFQEKKESISIKEIYALGLMGKENSKEKRKKISDALHLGAFNAKNLYQRLNYAEITKEEIEKIFND